jgi:hypothetical protein
MCILANSLPAPGQRQGQILERRASHSAAADEGNTVQAMQTPVLGFVYGADRGELRPILGLPGASVFGGPLPVPLGVTSVYFPPGQNYALIEQRSGEFIGLMTFQGANEGSVIAICGAISQPDIVSFSPSGNTGALYSKAEGRLQVITGLPGSPEVARIIPRDNLPDEVRFLALADDGVTLLEGTVHGAVYLLPEDGSPRFLHSAGDLEGLVFVPGKSDVVVYDREAGTAFLLQEVNTTSSYVVLAEGLTGLGGNAFLQVSPSSAVIAGTNSNSLWQIGLQSLGVQNISLPGMPLMLQPLRTSGKYLLYYRAGLPAWIFDTSEEEGVVSFVPASVTPRIHPRPVPMSTTDGLKLDTKEHPDLADGPSFGTGCAEVRRPPGRPRPLVPQM